MYWCSSCGLPGVRKIVENSAAVLECKRKSLCTDAGEPGDPPKDCEIAAVWAVSDLIGPGGSNLAIIFSATR